MAKQPKKLRKHKKFFSQYVILEKVAHDVVADVPIPTEDIMSANVAEPVATPSSGKFSSPYLRSILITFVILISGWMIASVYASSIMIGQLKIPAHSNDIALAKVLNKQASAYRLPIKYPNGTHKDYALKQMGLKLDTMATVKTIRHEQSQPANRFIWWKPLPSKLVLIKDKPVFDHFIASETNVTVQPSQDATLEILKGEIVLTDAVTGKQFGLPKPERRLLNAANNLQTVPIKLQTLTINPALTARILEPYKSTLEKTINQKVSFVMGDKILTPSPSQVAAWLEITPDAKSKKVDIVINSGKVLEYIDAATESDVHPAKAQIVVNRPDGTNQVLVNGLDGVDVTNKAKVASAVAKELLNGQGVNESLSVDYQHFQTISTGDYDKWIEVDLTNKQMYAYQHDQLVRTELVSAGAPDTPTVTGQYAIYAKFPSQDMRGNNVDGSRYFQPNVKWINYFYRDYAVHGNYWRPLSYFGNINSSHGCVSLPENEAEWMYNWAPINTPVIVHT